MNVTCGPDPVRWTVYGLGGSLLHAELHPSPRLLRTFTEAPTEPSHWTAQPAHHDHAASLTLAGGGRSLSSDWEIVGGSGCLTHATGRESSGVPRSSITDGGAVDRPDKPLSRLRNGPAGPPPPRGRGPKEATQQEAELEAATWGPTRVSAATMSLWPGGARTFGSSSRPDPPTAMAASTAPISPRGLRNRLTAEAIQRKLSVTLVGKGGSRDTRTANGGAQAGQHPPRLLRAGTS